MHSDVKMEISPGISQLPIKGGINSGANVLAARKIAKKSRNVVIVLPDRGERHLSVG